MTIDLSDFELDAGPPDKASDSPQAKSTPFPPPSVSTRGEMFFDLETVPDESRRPLFGLDEPVIQKPFVNPPVSGEAWVEWMKRPIAQIKDEIDGFNPDETWLEAFHAWERKEKKPRQGILDIVKNIRAARNPTADAEAEKTKKMSVTPEFCRIVAMGVALGENAPVDGFVIGRVEPQSVTEIDLLEWWWDRATSATSLVGYNIIGFDIPVIMVRSVILGVKPTRKFDTRPWGTDIIDLMAVRWPKLGAMKLKDLARVMGLDVPAGDCDGSQVAELFKNDPVKLAEYVKSDVIICQQLRQKWRGYFC